MFDGSLITYFPRPEDGVVASVDEIAAAVADWYAKNPGFQKNGDKIFQLMRKDGWEGWKAEGPPLLSNCPFYRKGYLPARTHGWDATMAEYDRKSEVYEYGYQVGHRALFSLRPGESFVREAGNRGLHVNMDVDPKLGRSQGQGARERPGLSQGVSAGIPRRPRRQRRSPLRPEPGEGRPGAWGRGLRESDVGRRIGGPRQASRAARGLWSFR